MNETKGNPQSAKEKFWQGHINGWQTSGLSQQMYCQHNLLALSTFGYWRRKLQVKESEKPRFYPLTISGALPSVSPQSGNHSIRVVLGANRFSIEIDDTFSPATLQRLILALEEI